MAYAPQAQTFFSVLGIAAGLYVVVVVALAILQRWWPGVGTVLGQLRPVMLPMAAVVAAVTTLGSLYFSEIAGYEPCKLCWLQRVFMYPLAVVLPIAAARRDTAVRWYGLPLAAIGAAVAIYHYQLEWFPTETTSCSAAVPCTEVYFRGFGFLSLAGLALIAFAAIAVSLVWARMDTKQESET